MTIADRIRGESYVNTIPLNEIISQIPPSIAITPVLPILELEDSLIMGNEDLSTIPEKELDEVIKSSVENLVLILSESEDISGSDSECDLSSCDDFSPINIPEGKSVTFSNPLFDSNDDFTSSDDESLSDEDVLEDNVKIYSNPLFEFDDEYISSDVNPLFDKVLENIESKDSYVSNLDEPTLLVTPLSDANKDECFDPGGEIDEIDAFLVMDISIDIENGYHDSEGDIIYFESFLIDDTILNLSPKVFLDHDLKNLKDETDNLKMESPFPLSSGSEDIIFDLDISAYSFYSSEPVAYECPMEVCSSTCFVPNITMIWGEIAPNYEDSRARGFVHHPLELQSFTYLYMGIRKEY
ncbi:hypothetical protein Tco_0359290 [Tanacetum coccineum]